MKLITRRSRTMEVVDDWRRQYEDGQYGQDKLTILLRLAALNLSTVDPDEVDDIIGNDNWTSPGDCTDCGAEDLAAVVQLGQEPDYESATANVCADCLRKALDLVTPKGGETP